MKRILGLFAILLFIVGCGNQEVTVQQEVSQDKGTLDLYLSGNDVKDFQSLAITVSGFKAYQGGNSVDISFASQEIELVKLKDSNVYELFQTALVTGNYDKLELSVSKVVAYLQGAKSVNVKLDPIVLTKTLTIEKDKTLEVVFDVKPEVSGDGYVLTASAETSGVVGKDVTDISKKSKDEVKPVQVIPTESEKPAATASVVETKPVEEVKAPAETPKETEAATESSETKTENSTETAKDILTKKEVVYVSLNGAVANPNPLTISVGDTVLWENIGKSAQQVYARTPYNYFRSERMLTEDTFNFTFTEAGTYRWSSAPFVKYLDATITVS